MINVTMNLGVLKILKINFINSSCFFISNLSFTAPQNYLYILLHIQLDNFPSSFNSGNGIEVAFKSGLHFRFVKSILNHLAISFQPIS